jgi:hypothetical protein
MVPGLISGLTRNPTGNPTENIRFQLNFGPDKLSQAQTCFWAGSVCSRSQAWFKPEISGSILGCHRNPHREFLVEFPVQPGIKLETLDLSQTVIFSPRTINTPLLL